VTSSAAAILLTVLAGCQSQSSQSAGTGAAEAARNYFDALARRDWPRAYELLHPESQRRFTAEQFARLAQNHLRNLSFEPTGVEVRFSEERGDQATAHVVLTGKGHYQDAAVLRRQEATWGVVLPANFGRATNAAR
jgi:hypothetical protein